MRTPKEIYSPPHYSPERYTPTPADYTYPSWPHASYPPPTAHAPPRRRRVRTLGATKRWINSSSARSSSEGNEPSRKKGPAHLIQTRTPLPGLLARQTAQTIILRFGRGGRRMVVESYASETRISQFERWMFAGRQGEKKGRGRKRTAATQLGRWIRHAAVVVVVVVVVVICYSCRYMVKTVGFELEIDHGR